MRCRSKAIEMCCGKRNGGRTYIFRELLFLFGHFHSCSTHLWELCSTMGHCLHNQIIVFSVLTKLRWIQSVWGENKGPRGSYVRDTVLVLTCGKVVGKPPRWHRDRRLEEDKNREEEKKKK